LGQAEAKTGYGLKRSGVRPALFSLAVPELTRSADIQLNKRLSLRRHREMLSQPQIVGRTSSLETLKLMDSTQRCRGQAAECVRLMNSAPTKDQAQVLENIAISWSRLAGQIDRYNELVRKAGLP
jgi:hypothetical protein